jgi:glycosyltransferase involved in cell wall biosynthesis
LQDLMASEYGDQDAALVPNSIDRFAFYAPPRGRQEVPTVGVLYGSPHFKGFDVSAAAIRLARKTIPNLRVVCFGSEKPQSRLPLPPNTKFHYRPSQDKIRNLYTQCDVWLTASRSEGFNLPALEAMACRAPVVSTKAGWPAEGIVQHVNGVLAEVDDIPALAAGINWVLSRTPIQWQWLSEAAYQTEASPSWTESAKMFERALLAA